jgi:hypothetical protein
VLTLLAKLDTSSLSSLLTHLSESLLWAATIFTSRAFISTHILPGHETVPILFPVVDILNHSVSAKVEWDFQPHTSFSLKLLEGDTFKPGQELYNNYAPKQNDELLLGYGFCLENNPTEQFSLKLAFPPMLQEYAQQMELFKPENVPYGMSTDFLKTDPNTEQHFLRAKEHLFGRYENCIPFFRGIPPYIVHFFFIQTLLSLDLDIKVVNVQRPGTKITLQVLSLLQQAMTQRSQTLPLFFSGQPQNDKQTYAKIYRDGQARIIHAIRDELQSAINRIRAPKDEVPFEEPMLIDWKEALFALAVEPLSGAMEHFKSGIAKHDLSDPADESIIWTLLFVCFAAGWLTWHKDDGSLIKDWLRTLYHRYPLPNLEDGIEDADTYTFVDDNIADFLKLPNHEGEADLIGTIDTVGEEYEHVVGDHKKDYPALIRGKTENLGARTIMWAMKVAEQEVVPVLEDGVVRKCIYVHPWSALVEGVTGERWMYEE